MSSKVRLKMLVYGFEGGISRKCFKNMVGGLRPFYLEKIQNVSGARIRYLIDDGFFREWHLRCFSIIDYRLYEKKC